jgi:transposase InsO family protein
LSDEWTVLYISYNNLVKNWHEVLGHCNADDILKLENVVEGMKITGKKKFECGICIEGKMTQYRSRNSDRRATTTLELVHCDLAGPVDPIAKDGFRYALSFIDDYSGLIMVNFLKQKSDTTRATKRYLADIAPYGSVESIEESTPFSSVKRLRSDNGGEFTSKEFESLLVESHIKHEKSAPYSPHQNDTVERAWHSIFEMARCLLLQAGLPKTMWSYAVMAAAYTRDRCYNPRTQKTAIEAFSGNKPDVSNMHVFGNICYAYVQNKKKLDARCQKGVFVGYDKGSPAITLCTSQRVKRSGK